MVAIMPRCRVSPVVEPRCGVKTTFPHLGTAARLLTEILVCPCLTVGKELAGRVGERLRAEGFLDPQRLVPLRHALGAGEAADLELGNAPADREVHDRDVLGLARACRYDRAVARLARGIPAG